MIDFYRRGCKRVNTVGVGRNKIRGSEIAKRGFRHAVDMIRKRNNERKEDEMKEGRQLRPTR